MKKPTYTYKEMMDFIWQAETGQELRLIRDVLEPEKKRYPLVEILELFDILKTRLNIFNLTR
jgi:hypothetical protein